MTLFLRTAKIEFYWYQCKLFIWGYDKLTFLKIFEYTRFIFVTIWFKTMNFGIVSLLPALQLFYKISCGNAHVL